MMYRFATQASKGAAIRLAGCPASKPFLVLEPGPRLVTVLGLDHGTRSVNAAHFEVIDESKEPDLRLQIQALRKRANLLAFT